MFYGDARHFWYMINGIRYKYELQQVVNIFTGLLSATYEII